MVVTDPSGFFVSFVLTILGLEDTYFGSSYLGTFPVILLVSLHTDEFFGTQVILLVSLHTEGFDVPEKEAFSGFTVL